MHLLWGLLFYTVVFYLRKSSNTSNVNNSATCSLFFPEILQFHDLGQDQLLVDLFVLPLIFCIFRLFELLALTKLINLGEWTCASKD